MKPLFLAFILFIGLTAAHAQQPTKSDTSKTTHIEIESEFPGGFDAWRQFLSDNFRYPDKAVMEGIQGVVMVQFIVDASGKVDSVIALTGPEMLRAAAVKIIQRSPKWIPATIDGKKVKSYKKQPITYKMELEPKRKRRDRD